MRLQRSWGRGEEETLGGWLGEENPGGAGPRGGGHADGRHASQGRCGPRVRADAASRLRRRGGRFPAGQGASCPTPDPTREPPEPGRAPFKTLLGSFERRSLRPSATRGVLPDTQPCLFRAGNGEAILVSGPQRWMRDAWSRPGSVWSGPGCPRSSSPRNESEPGHSCCRPMRGPFQRALLLEFPAAPWMRPLVFSVSLQTYTPPQPRVSGAA
ncbi:uncharacterized protein LOC122684263 [Cervus elaphus]|uniref:uncharacterized protein LOC122433990 n=1 Tax=Cervus canadensis TaxID=1574408 RepID=UPI001CA34602|nr:uncharacterized protein LOC122433990 [Cervus canadensis]XP_043744206.1 uncharacterized protein LOC122684263 [Cervus elaphus]